MSRRNESPIAGPPRPDHLLGLATSAAWPAAPSQSGNPTGPRLDGGLMRARSVFREPKPMTIGSDPSAVVSEDNDSRSWGVSTCGKFCVRQGVHDDDRRPRSSAPHFCETKPTTADGEWLELPYSNQYADDRVSMILLLPRKGRLSAIEQRLAPAAIQDAVEKLGMHSGKVSLPKFQVRTMAQLKDELIHLGMPLAFSGGADFSGMTGSRELCIGSVIHQAYVNVDEFGTEAAAATAVEMLHERSPPFSFMANRPFLFLIRDNYTGSILLSGRVVRPGELP